MLIAFLTPAKAWATDAFPGTDLGSALTFSVTESNTASTGQAGEPTTFGAGSLNTNWFTWKAPATGNLTIQTCSTTVTNFDTTLNVYTGTAVNALTAVASNDDACANTTPNAYASLISMTATSGTTYRIQVDGYASGTGTYLFQLNFTPPTVSIANTTNGSETGPVNGVMTVTQSAVSATPTVVAYSLSGTATPGSDYTAPSGSVTIPAGATTATITLPVINDAIVEGPETAIVTLTAVTSGVSTLGATVAATNTIADNDSGTVSIAGTTNGSEAGPVNGVFTVTQTAASATNTVVAYTVAGTATAGSDYTALSGSVTIPAGSTSAAITVPVINDIAVESTETVIVTLSSITSGLTTLGSPAAATINITDNDLAVVNIAATTSGNEAGPVSGVFTVSQGATTATNTVVTYTVSGTATAGSDYTALSGSVTIPAGSASATIAVPVINDALVETTETVIVTLTGITSGSATLGTPTVATVNILDNDTATVSIAATTSGAEAGPVNGVFTVTQTAASATATVVAYSVSGTATSGSDFMALSGSVTIAAGATTATITVPVIDDAIVEPAETVMVTLTSVTAGLATIGSPAAATVGITDNDSATVSIAATLNGSEAGPVNATFTVTQSAVSATGTVLAYGVAGTATAGSDYTALSGSVTIPAGSTTATITVAVTDDAIVEPSETVIVTLSSVTAGLATLGAPLTATLTLADNDSATVSIAATTHANEAGPVHGVFTVTQSAVSASDTVIGYTAGGTATAGSDYTALSGSVTIPAGATSATITVPVIDDLVVESSETVVLTLSAISSGLATLGTPVTATISIADNDVAAFTIGKTVNSAAIAAPGTLTYTITVANTGNVPLTAPVLSDTLSNGAPLTLTTGPALMSGDAAPLGVLDAGEHWTYSATFAVTQALIDGAATISNTASFTTAEAPQQTSPAAVTTITVTPHLTMVKTADKTGPVAKGDIIHYTYQITNDGNVTMHNVVVNETFNGYGTTPVPGGETLQSDAAPLSDSSDGGPNGAWDTLAPGDTVSFTASYEVQQQDIDSPP